MPKGVPVATMAINNSYNAGLLAARILGLSSKSVQKKLSAYQESLKVKVQNANRKMKKDILQNL